MAQLVAAIAIELETLASHAAVFRIVADDLDDAFEAAEEWHAFIMQADQQIMMREFVAAMIQYDRHLLGFCRIAPAVRDEGGGGIMPEQFVQCCRWSLHRAELMTVRMPFCIALWLNWQAVRSLSVEPV